MLRAHNSLWLHTEVSSMKYLSSLCAWVADLRIITRVLRDILGQHWILQVPNKQSTQMCIKFATLC